MIQALVNPERFMAFSRWAAPLLGVLAVIAAAAGLWLDFRAPPDYQQGYSVHFMFIHVPAAFMSEFVYACLGVASFLSLVFRHALAQAAARAAAPLGAGFTALALITGSLWGRPTWGAWWVWGDPRLTSVLVLFLFYVGYMALDAAVEDEAAAGRACAILALVGLINLPIVHFSVTWWNSLHQGSSLFRAGGPSLPPVYLAPLMLMLAAYLAAFGGLWLVRIRGEIWRRRAAVAAIRAAG
jgi:heme exporter protein C